MFIYKITNLINGKIYIGQTIHSIKYRFDSHCRKSRSSDVKHMMAICKAIKKYGRDSFKVEEIGGANSMSELNYQEWLLIHLNGSAKRGVGYNMMDGGLNRKPNHESRLKNALAHGTNPIVAYKITKFNGDLKSGQYTVLDVEFAGEWQIKEQCRRDLMLHGVYSCLKGLRLSTKGYIIKYKDEFPDKASVMKWATKFNGAKVSKSNTFCGYKDGVCIGEWNNMSQCARDLNIGCTGVYGCLVGRYKTTKKYTFSYK